MLSSKTTSSNCALGKRSCASTISRRDKLLSNPLENDASLVNSIVTNELASNQSSLSSMNKMCDESKGNKTNNEDAFWSRIASTNTSGSSIPLRLGNKCIRKARSLGDLRDSDSSDCNYFLNLIPRPIIVNRLEFEGSEKDANSLMGSSMMSNGTDQGASSEIMGELESPSTNLEVYGILNNKEISYSTDEENIFVDNVPQFEFVVDTGTDKSESLSSTSNSQPAPGKAGNLRISIPNDINSFTGIPHSPTLYISGVSICRSPSLESSSQRTLIPANISHLSLSPRLARETFDSSTKPGYDSLFIPSSRQQNSLSLSPRFPRESGSYSFSQGKKVGRHNSFHSTSTFLEVPGAENSRNRSTSLFVPRSPSIFRRFEKELTIPEINVPTSPTHAGRLRPEETKHKSDWNTPIKDTIFETDGKLRNCKLRPEISKANNAAEETWMHRRQSVQPNISRKPPRNWRKAKALSLSGDNLNAVGGGSLQATRNSSPTYDCELRLSKSASEYEKSRAVFEFPDPLSCILHVEESNLSSDDFHEALFLSNRSPGKRRKSKKERSSKSKCK